MYGNLTKSGSLSFTPCYNNNNQYTCLPNLNYDADGNLLNDSFHTYTWDAFGSLTSIDGNPQYHDAFGRLVEWKDPSGTTYELMYSPAGAKIGMMTGQTLAVGRIPLPGGAIASYGPSGLNNYAHADWLGSTRFSSYASSRTMKWDLAHAPYGEIYALTGGGAEFTFTGQFSDYGNTNTLWDFPMREYRSSQGRWISPDPAGLAAVNPMNPQTWNRYAYVAGNPLSNVDPLGLCEGDGRSNFVPHQPGNFVANGSAPCPKGMVDETTIDDAIGNGPGSGDGCSVGIGLLTLNFASCPRAKRTLSWDPIRHRLVTEYLQAKLAGMNFTNEFKEGGCVNQFFQETFGDEPKSQVSQQEQAIKATTQAGAYVGASTYAAERGLVVPMRSSIVRGILEAGETFGEVIVVGMQDISELKAIVNEGRSYARGECQ